MHHADAKALRAVIAEHQDTLLGLPNVVGVGVSERAGTPVIQVLVNRKVPASDLGEKERIPSELGGFACHVQELGVVQAQGVQAGGAR